MKNHVKTVASKAAQFAEITKYCIRQGNITRAKRCLDVAGLLFTTGSAETKNAIGNIYVFSVSTFMELRSCTVANLFPPVLRREYISQINTPGI